ncbi:transcriptional repressor [Sulfurimonas sp. SAG-AH-194-I05]|nr:transcriptional repressor [Sulfurimonas sp. SAG-AH-194-I05]MDF1874597.1 transcriptional repressor [Sulfurimonas sp. SAG-AH-194-I05]
MINYTNILREHTLKATPQRLAITDVLYTNGHINIESLYEKMIKKFTSISLATIYKNINLMLEHSFIQEVKLPNAKSVYELTKETHSHIVCTTCGSIEDISLDLNKVIMQVSESNAFHTTSSDLVLSGICIHCK